MEEAKQQRISAVNCVENPSPLFQMIGSLLGKSVRVKNPFATLYLGENKELLSLREIGEIKTQSRTKVVDI